jgi:hypothetical protein
MLSKLATSTNQIQKEVINGCSFYYYNQKWQKPVITEEQTFNLFLQHKNIPTNYFAFPWAELIDGHLDKSIIWELQNFKVAEQSCFTIIQHIYFRKLLQICKNIGITHIFTPHKQDSDLQLEQHFNIKILGYSLYPVHIYNNISSSNTYTIKFKSFEERKYFASFIGQYEFPYYISDIRLKIFDIFSKYEDCFVKRREKWHYWDIVYGGKSDTNKLLEEEYKHNLADTVFSLCPSGSGPNSIRIWESMSFGCIPVILADTLILPDLDIDYKDIFIFFPENNIQSLHRFLKLLKRDKIEKMMMKNIEIFNKYFCAEKINSPILQYFAK